jgi:hypothetical protein
MNKKQTGLKNKSAADFAASSKVMRGLYELLVQCGVRPKFGRRGASFRVTGNVLARLELRDCPRAIVEIDDDVLWVSLEEPVTKNLPAATVQKLKDVVLPLAAYGAVNPSIALNSLPQKKLNQVRDMLAECFTAQARALPVAPGSER